MDVTLCTCAEKRSEKFDVVRNVFYDRVCQNALNKFLVQVEGFKACLASMDQLLSQLLRSPNFDFGLVHGAFCLRSRPSFISSKHCFGYKENHQVLYNETSP